MRKRLFISILFCSAVLSTSAFAKDVKFEVNIDNNEIAIGESAQLGLTFYGTQDIPAPDIGNIDGFDVRYLGPSTMMTVINGRVSSSVTHMYRLVPLRVGRFQVGPFSFKYRGDSYTSNMVFVEVGEGKRIARIARKEEETSLIEKQDLKDRLFLTLAVDKTRAYANELIPVIVKLYVNRLNLSDIQLPAFDQEGFSKADFKEPKQYREEVNGMLYEVLEFKTSIFGTRPGEYRLGPAKIKCNLVVRKRMRTGPSRIDEFFEDDFYGDSYFENFFTRYERHPIELKSEELSINILPLPTEGRPASFSGAVGDYQFIFNASPTEVKTGDPITLKMEVNGNGNFNTVLVPKFEEIEGFKVYEAQAKTGTNTKVFTQVLIPETEDVTETPKANFSYFDPDRRVYKTIAQGPIPIHVEKAKDQTPARVVGPSTSPSMESPSRERDEPNRDIIYIKEKIDNVRERGGEIYRNKIFLAAMPIPLIVFAAFYIFYARTERLKRDARYSRRVASAGAARKGLKALRRHIKSVDQKLFYETLFKALQDYIGSRFGMAPAGITFDTVDPILVEKEIDLDIRGVIKSLFDICDEARFAFFEADELRMQNDIKNLEKVIKYFERLRL